MNYHRFTRWLLKLVIRPGFWFILVLLIFITAIHYHGVFPYPSFVSSVISDLGLDRHAFERILYLAPVVWAGFLFGWRGALVASLAALAGMLPRVFFISLYPVDAFFETGAVFIIGNVLAFSFESLRRERDYRTQLEETRKELESSIITIREDEKRLATLNQIASTVSESLELDEILNSSIDKVVDIMGVDLALIFLLNEEIGKLELSVYRGMSAEFAQAVDLLGVGEGFNGTVAATGEPLFVADASEDPRLTREVVSEQKVGSLLIVPLSSKGRVSGTLCVAMRGYRNFRPEEVELLTAVGNQISVAVDNARLYRRQQEVAERLKVSEERYRELFANAHDAIWLHDLAGNIMAVNLATGKLIGYTAVELMTMNVRSFLSAESLSLAGQIRRRLLANESVTPYEQRLIRKDGSEALVQLATSLVYDRGHIIGFQHIARDITEQKKMEENLQFFLQQCTRSQEEERKRISRELHDETIQSLVVLSRQLDSLLSGKNGLSEENRHRLEDLWQQTNKMMKELRRLCQDLRPAALDRLGLVSALEWLADDVENYSGIATSVRVVGTEPGLAEEVKLVLFRITQEALRNVWRHAVANTAEIIAEFNENSVIVIVRDNGKGFQLPDTIGDLARDGKLGLAGMQERARLIGANLKVESEPGKGTSITVQLPV